MMLAAPQEVRRQMSIQTVIYTYIQCLWLLPKQKVVVVPAPTHSLIINTKFR
jgi:hypothetical protein